MPEPLELYHTEKDSLDYRPAKKQCHGLAARESSKEEDMSAEKDEVPTSSPSPQLRPRAYQREMFEASMKENIIICMDTGSGKTQIAILRIQAELERSPPEKLVWFLAPTVVLAEQQHSTISQQLAQYQSRLITGADNVEFWSTQKVWDAVLLNIRIVVSTPQILLDALSNGFVSMQRLSLLVYDEAHMALKAAVSNRIMQSFYHPHLREYGTKAGLPHILGLTASPIASRVKQMEDLQKNLHARCKTPQLHHEELMRHVHRPKLELLPVTDEEQPASRFIEALDECVYCYDIQADPDVRWLKTRRSDRHKRELEKIFSGKKQTHCQEQLKAFRNRAQHLHENLGPWASHRYIYTCLQRLKQVEVNEHMIAHDWECERDLFLQRTLARLGSVPPPPGLPDKISNKVEVLLKFLTLQYTPGLSCVIFVQQRACAKLLSDLLSLHPQTSQIIRPTSIIGDARHAKRKERFDVFDPDEQKNAVQGFKDKKSNLIVATSVLEEGIDVSACHLVITFDELSNLRSFIQRRGRARKSGSTFAVFATEQSKLEWLGQLEQLMKVMYADDLARAKELEAAEDIDEDEYDGIFSDTGAHLSLENARARLQHFCATLGCAYTDTSPDFIIEEIGSDPKKYSAKVLLPSLLGPQFRSYEGIQIWFTQKMAIRDAAFQACKALYGAGLLNDSFLPTHRQIENDLKEPTEKRKATALGPRSASPWLRVAAAWKSSNTCYRVVVEDTSKSGLMPPRMFLLLPVPLPCPISLPIYWNEDACLQITLTPMTAFDKKLIPHAAEATHLILESVIPGRIDPTSRDFTSVFLPDVQLTAEAIEAWCASSKGNTPASNYSNSDASALQSLGLVRQKNLQSRPWVAKEFVAIEEEVLDKEGNPGVTVEVLHVRGIIWPKRTDFSHPVSGEAHTHEKSYRVDRAMVANLPAAYSRFGLFVPALLHRLELYLHAQELRDTILKPLGIEDLDLVVTAISSPVAQEQTNYQRLEFLGDAALKLYTSMQLAAAKPQWHEGLLTAFKEKIVSNHRLSAAAIEKGIDRYILVDVFTGLKWRPNYNKNFAEPEELPTRELSTKVLADVVEALIGATLLDGDLDKIKTSLDFFLPEVSWLSVDEQNRLLFDEVPQELDDVSFANVEKIEKMIGYQFEKKTLLIEALTHPSTLCATMPYQRLEFVGDALLDFFVTRPIFDSPLELSAPEMHLMRSVLVNGDFLAFLCMNISCDEERHEVVPGKKAETVTTKKINQRLNLVQTMRHGNPDLVDPQNKTLERFEHLKGELDVALKTSERYPWVSLCKIQAPKYMSDLVESLLGAIFVDSHGSTDECLKFLSRIGLMQYLERVITGKIRLKHPKQELGELVGIRKVRYATIKQPDWRVTSSVFVDEELVATVEDALSDLEAETTAAQKAIGVWRASEHDSPAQSKEDDIPSPASLD